MIRVMAGLVGLALAVGGVSAAIVGTDESFDSGNANPSPTTDVPAEDDHDEHPEPAATFSEQVEVGIARFEDVEVAYAEGYVMNARAAEQPGRRKHFRRQAPNPQVLDPAQPEGLVYYVDGDTAILLGAVFIERSDAVLEEEGTHWHDHAAESGNANAPNMMHVWTYQGVGNPLGTTFIDSLPPDWERGDPWPFT